MDEINFRIFLENRSYKGKRYTEKSIAHRMTKARKAEEILNCTLDSIVDDDEKMYHALVKLQENENPAHNPMQNALRKYYIFKNSKEFPYKKEYEMKYNLKLKH